MIILIIRNKKQVIENRRVVMLKKKFILWSVCLSLLCLHTMGFSLCVPQNEKCEEGWQMHWHEGKKKKIELVYYLYIQDFLNSMIAIPTSNVTDPSSTIDSRYLAGRAPIYKNGDEKFGICSASFLCMQNQSNIFSNISNFLVADNGLIVSWLTPSTLLNLELDSIIHGMVTECIVTASTKVGFNPFYGKQFNMVVSSDDQKIYFKLTPISRRSLEISKFKLN